MYYSITDNIADNIDLPIPNQSLYINKSNIIEMKSIISSLKDATATGHDNISTIMIKLLDDKALEPLVHIINDIINTGIVPISFKTAIITLVYKKR